MIISYEKKSGATVETGENIDLSSLKGANGYAIVDFNLNKNFEEIPVIRDYLLKEYSSAADSITINNAKAEMIFNDPKEKEILTYDFSLKKGRNKHPICELGKTNKEITNVDIRIVSFDGSFKLAHSFID